MPRKESQMEELPKCPYNCPKGKDPFEDVLKKISASRKTPARREKILLVVPPSPQIPTPGREFLVTGPFEGFTCVATLIKKMGYRLKVIDCRMRENAVDEVVKEAADSDLVGLATYCDSYLFLEDVTRKIKDNHPEKIIFLGGPLVTSLPEILLSNISADCAVLGEAELTLIEFLESMFVSKRRGFENIKGMAYKRAGKIVINKPRPQITDLDVLPLLDYTIWPNYESIVKNGQIIISSTRGCPQQCSFCFKTLPLLRLKSIERVEEEVVYLKKTTKFNYTWLNDLTFNVIVDRAMKICDVLKKYDVKYHCFARVKNAPARLMKKLKETGCAGIWFGLESCDQTILDLNRKNIKVADLGNAINTAEAAGLGVRGLFIVGLYGETEEALQKMFEFIKKNTFLPLVKYLVPFPGTSLYAHAVNRGIIKDPVKFLRALSRRKVKDSDDEIVNVTGLDDKVLREYFHKIWTVTKEREPFFSDCA